MVEDDASGILVTVIFPPHAVTRKILNGADREKTLTEFTVLLIEMSRHAGSLGAPRTAAPRMIHRPTQRYSGR